MKVLNKLDSLDNINDGETRKLPTKTSQLTNDSGYITSADVPTKTSELTNDSNFITNTGSTSGNAGTATTLQTYTYSRNNSTNTWFKVATTTMPKTNQWAERHAFLFIKGSHNSNYNQNGIIAIDAVGNSNKGKIGSYNAQFMSATQDLNLENFYIEFLDGDTETDGIVNFWIRANTNNYASWQVKILQNTGWTIASSEATATTMPSTNYTGKKAVLAGSSARSTGDKNGNDITTTYATKTELENFSRNDLAILNSKEYTGLYGSANDQDGASFYFASVRPTNFYDVWRVKYKVYGNVPNQNNYKQYSIVELFGNQDNVSFTAFNRSYSTNYVTYYYNNVYRLTSTGYNAGYSHTLGIGLRNATNPTSSSYPRTIRIELLETENCTVSFFDEAIKRTSISGQGSTNFGGVVEINARDNGLQETGDATNIWQLRKASGNYITSTALYRYMLLLPKNETTLIPVNAVDNSTATNKTLTTEEFDPFGPIYYYNSTTAVNANAAISGGSLYYQSTLDLRYSFNTGTTLTNNREVYLVAVPQSNGKAKLHSSPITQTLPTSADGKIYIYLGHTYSNYQIELSYRHPVYEYKDGAIRLYTNAAASGGGTITDVQVDGNSIVSNGVANLNTISTYNASTNPIATYNEIDTVESYTSQVEHMVSELGSEQWSNLSTLDYNGHTGATNVLEALENIEDGLFEVNDVLSYEKVDKEIAGTSTDKTFIDHDGSLMTLEASNTNNDTESSIRLYPNGNLSLYGDNVYINNVATPTSNGAAANKQYVDTQVATKQNTLVSGTNIKTINNQSLLGSGDLDIISGGDTLPVGAIIPYSGSTIPTNFLLADGSAVSRTTYSELFEAIGTTYGAGDGSTTFNLPDLRGKVAVGLDSQDTDFDTLGLNGGSKYLQAHSHTVTNKYGNVSTGNTWAVLSNYGNTQAPGTTLIKTLDAGEGDSGNLQPYITQNYIIKAKKSTTALDLGYITDSYSDSTTDAYSANMVNSLVSVSSGNDTLPIGAIVPFSGDSIPTNYLLANGSAVSRTTYSELFDVIGTTYGTGDGSTTFNLPNLKGRIPVGLDDSDTSFDTLGETGGEKTHKLTINEMPSHTHDQYVTANNGNQAIRRDYSSDGGSAMFPQGCATAPTGGGQAHNNLQPYITQKYLIKAKMSTSALNLGLVTDTYSDSTTDAYSANYVNNLLKNLLLDNIYPIGSIYMSTNNTNPNTLFGGVWESWGAGRVPVGVDTNDTDFDTVEETGGEKTHTLTTNEMPSHTHIPTWSSNCPPWVQAGGYGQITAAGTASANRANTGGITINNAGGSQAHNNLQPYITCYMWKRTA